MSWWDSQPQPPADPGLNASSYATPNTPAVPNNLAAYLGQNGSILDPYTKQFAPPTEQDALNSPGLKYALSEALRTGQASAAAKGTLLNGRTLQGLEQNAIGTALQGYGDVYNRSLGQYLLDRENFERAQDRPYAKLTGTAALGKPGSNS